MKPDTRNAGPREPATPGRVTEILLELRGGADGAQDDLFRLVYSELKRVAAAQLRKQRRAPTLDPTALVHEVYLRLLGGPAESFEDRRHFFGAAAHAMRLVLVDLIRRRNAKKRGGSRIRVTFDESRHADSDRFHEVLAVHEALDRLRAIDEQKSRVVELRFFAGLTIEEIAGVLDVTERTVYRLWDRARAWLYHELSK